MLSILRRWSLLVVAVVFACGAAIYCHQTYFFNPLTFRNSIIVNQPFNSYKNPMQIQVWGAKKPTSRVVLYTTFDSKTIRFVLTQLQNSRVVSAPSYTRKVFTFLHITLRSGASPTSPILQDVLFSGQYWNIGQVQTQIPGNNLEYIMIAPALEQWIMNAVTKGKPVG